MPKRRFFKSWLTALFAAGLLSWTTSHALAQAIEVSYQNKLLSVRCSEAPLVRVFEEIESATGMELILEDPIKTKRLTADIEGQPLNLAIERLLEGIGVNYAMAFDREDWQRVAKIFIGEGGGAIAPSPPPASRASSRRSPRRRPTPTDDSYDDYGDDMENEEGLEEDPGAVNDAGNVQNPPPAQPPSQSPLPPPPAFPRSSFTPGLESSPFGSSGSTQLPGTGAKTTPSPSTGSPGNPPPAYYPFFDQFGRPIQVPQPGTGSQQNQQQKQQKNQQEDNKQQ